MEKIFISGSSHVVCAEYDNKDMFVTFRNGAKYRYLNVSRETFHVLASSDSAGKFFHSFIRNKYITEKV